MHVAPTEPPNALRRIAANLTAIQIAWNPINCTHQNSIITSYIVCYWNKYLQVALHNIEIIVSASVTNVTIEKLDINTEYSFLVQGMNENNQTSPSIELNTSTSVPKSN